MEGKWSIWCTTTDCTFIGIFPLGLKQTGSGVLEQVNLAALGVGWDEQHLQFRIPVSCDKLFTKLSNALVLLFKLWK